MATLVNLGQSRHDAEQENVVQCIHQHWVKYKDQWRRFSSMDGNAVYEAFSANASMATHMRQKFERELSGCTSPATGMFTSCDAKNKVALMNFFFSDVDDAQASIDAHDVAWMFVSLNFWRSQSFELDADCGLDDEQIKKVTNAMTDSTLPVIEAVVSLSDDLVLPLIRDYAANTNKSRC